MLVLGLRVEKTIDSDDVPYTVYGPRATYFLVRNNVQRDMLFLVNFNGGKTQPKIKGYSWFREVGDTLVAVR